MSIAILFTFPDSESYMSLVHPSAHVWNESRAWLLQKGPFFRFELNQFIFQWSWVTTNPKKAPTFIMEGNGTLKFSSRFVLYCLILPIWVVTHDPLYFTWPWHIQFVKARIFYHQKATFFRVRKTPGDYDSEVIEMSEIWYGNQKKPGLFNPWSTEFPGSLTRW